MAELKSSKFPPFAARSMGPGVVTSKRKKTPSQNRRLPESRWIATSVPSAISEPTAALRSVTSFRKRSGHDRPGQQRLPSLLAMSALYLRVADLTGR